jgi:hypothetical protein
MGISREMVFALLTFLIIPVIVLLQAPLRFGSLEVEKTSSCSKPQHNTNASSKEKPVEPFFTLCKNVSKGKQDGIRLHLILLSGCT